MLNYPEKLKIGTRSSALALAQTEIVRKLLADEFPNLLVEIVPMQTSGDKHLQVSLAEIGGKGLFAKELEETLLDKRIDIAVHSLKDMETKLPAGLIIPCVLEREDVREALLSPCADSLQNLPQNTRFGTSSVRRAAQLLHLRPDLQIVPFRGNVATRLQKLQDKVADATLLSFAGLKRLNSDAKIAAIIETDMLLPAVAQGAIGIECREDDVDILQMLSKLNHAPSQICTQAERAMLAALDGSCRTPIAGHAVLQANGDLFLRAEVFANDGSVFYATTRTGNLQDAYSLGRDAGEQLRHEAAHILNFFYL